jgi:hypothetical protein
MGESPVTLSLSGTRSRSASFDFAQDDSLCIKRINPEQLHHHPYSADTKKRGTVAPVPYFLGLVNFSPLTCLYSGLFTPNVLFTSCFIISARSTMFFGPV